MKNYEVNKHKFIWTENLICGSVPDQILYVCISTEDVRWWCNVIEVHIVIMFSDSAQMQDIHKVGLTKFWFSRFASRLSHWIVGSNQWRRESFRSIFAEENKSTRVHRVDKNQQYWTLSRHWAHLSLYIRYVKILFIFEKEKEKVDCWYNRIFLFFSFW